MQFNLHQKRKRPVFSECFYYFIVSNRILKHCRLVVYWSVFGTDWIHP